MLKNLRNKFYAGPQYLGREPWKGWKYQSPTLTAWFWLYAWSARIFTMPGRIILLCSGLVFMYALMSIQMPIYNLAIILIMLYMADAVAGFFMRPKIEVRRLLPAAIRQDAKSSVIYEISNRRSRPACSVNLDTLPMPANVKLARRQAWVDAVPPGESRRIEVELTSDCRGEYTLPAVRFDTSFPFHLWRWGGIQGFPERLLVHPRFTSLRQFNLPVGRTHQPGGLTMSSNLADSMEFYGCREYRYGDNPRHIHWRSWARTGFPVVREFRQEYFPRVALVLDIYRPLPWHRVQASARDEAFEGAVSIVAAVGEYLSRLDYVVDFFAAGREVYRFQSGRSLGYFEQLLDILACLEPHRNESFDKLRPAVAAEAGGMSGIVLVLLNWDDERRQMLEDVAASNSSARLILVNKTGIPPADFPERGTVIKAEEANVIRDL